MILYSVFTCIGFLYPETSRRSLEDMEALFNQDYQCRSSLDHVRDEAVRPDEVDAPPPAIKATPS